jgi:hypothetical protein
LESPEQIAARLMAPASTSALWTYGQVRALIIAAVRTCDQSLLDEAATVVGGSITIEGENWTGEAHETARDMDAKVKAIAPSSGGPKGSAGR